MSHQTENIIQNLSIDCVVFGFENSRLEVLLIKRKLEPEKDKWALPGGFILKNESLDDAAVRILEETSSVKNIYLEQIHTFGDVNRYPLRRVITIGYYALIDPDKHSLKPGIDTTDVKWFPVNNLPEVPFDHNEIIEAALEKLRKQVRTEPVGFELLPKKFTLTQLQILYESILGTQLDKRNFRKKILGLKILIALDEYQKSVAHRAARLYKFDTRRYKKLSKKGYNFEI